MTPNPYDNIRLSPEDHLRIRFEILTDGPHRIEDLVGGDITPFRDLFGALGRATRREWDRARAELRAALATLPRPHNAWVAALARHAQEYLDRLSELEQAGALNPAIDPALERERPGSPVVVTSWRLWEDGWLCVACQGEWPLAGPESDLATAHLRARLEEILHRTVPRIWMGLVLDLSDVGYDEGGGPVAALLPLLARLVRRMKILPGERNRAALERFVAAAGLPGLSLLTGEEAARPLPRGPVAPARPPQETRGAEAPSLRISVRIDSWRVDERGSLFVRCAGSWGEGSTTAYVQQRIDSLISDMPRREEVRLVLDLSVVEYTGGDGPVVAVVPLLARRRVSSVEIVPGPRNRAALESLLRAVNLPGISLSPTSDARRST